MKEQLDLLKKKIQDYKEHNVLLEDLQKILQEASIQLGLIDKRNYDENIKLAQVINDRFKCDKELESNTEFIKRISEDLVLQEQAHKSVTEDMNENYAKYIGFARNIQALGIEPQVKAAAKGLIKRYEDGKRNTVDFQMIKQMVAAYPDCKVGVIKPVK